MSRYLKWLFLGATLLVALVLGLYQVPAIHSRLEWRLIAWQTQIKYALFPPEEFVFVPQSDPQLIETQIAKSASLTFEALTPSHIPTMRVALTLSPTGILQTETPFPTTNPTIIPSPTLSPTPIPSAVNLTGIRHEYESWNNCGPATLGMQLSYWGWEGDQRDTAAVLKPNPRDKNVSPHEMADYVHTYTDLQALFRVGGDLATLKALIAAGYPVIIEKTLELPGTDGWVGHYSLVSGYNDARGRFITQDSYVMSDYPLFYEDVAHHWQSFNYLFFVVYPSDRESEVLTLLGPFADEEASYALAIDKAQKEIDILAGRERYFAWFNLGMNLVSLEEYTAAAEVFDSAFSVYSSLDPEERPWRLVWYQHGPFMAYYHAERYRDLIDLATTTLSAMGEQTVEEIFYWRGLAKDKIGDSAGAVADLQKAVQLNANFQTAVQALDRLMGK